MDLIGSEQDIIARRIFPTVRRDVSVISHAKCPAGLEDGANSLVPNNCANNQSQARWQVDYDPPICVHVLPGLR